MKHLVLLITICIGCSFNLSAQENSSTWIWQVSGNGLEGKSYILGVLPVQDSLAFEFPERVWKYLNKADVVVTIQDVNNPQAQAYHTNAFGSLRQDYNQLPSEYIATIARQDLKPIVELSPDFDYNGFYKDQPQNKVQSEDAQKAIDQYRSGKVNQLTQLRIDMDVPTSVYNQLATRTNYEILTELTQYMAKQPVFMPIDVIYLGGQSGLIQLLIDRGYKVKALEEKHYARKADEIEQLRAIQAQMNNTYYPAQNNDSYSQTNNSSSGQVIQVQEQMPVDPVKLDLPKEVLNLNQWSEYEIQDSLLIYRAPQRLKKDETGQKYSAVTGALTYEIDFVQPWKKQKDEVEKLIISNGGQLVNEGKIKTPYLSGDLVELMYAENQVSKHILIDGIGQNIIVSVRGTTPEIYSIVANEFLNSIQLKNVVSDAATGVVPTPLPEVASWTVIMDNSLRLSFPQNAQEENKQLENGQSVKTYYSSKKIDENTYVLTISDRKTFDNFKLFNDAINTASSELRAVIEDRNVMPDGNEQRAEYILKDAIGNYYRIVYLFDGAHFYQIYIKGDKKSIKNDNADIIVDSAIINPWQ